MNKKGTLFFGRVSSWYLGCKLKASATLSTSLRWCLLARTSQCLVFHLDVRCRSQCAEGGPNSVSKNHVSSSSKNEPKSWAPCNSLSFFLARARCLSAGLRYLRLTRLPRHDRGPVPGGNRSAASCLCTVLRRALYHYATRSPPL